ncbi:hypothetical protein [Kaarinaea lacus]
MNWKLKLFTTLTLVIQMLVMFLFWWNKWLVSEIAPLYLAIAVLTIGIASGMLLWSEKHKQQTERPIMEKSMSWIGGFLVIVGAYLTYIPVMSVFRHSSIAALFLVAGVLSPTIISKYFPMRGGRKNI